MFFLSKNMRRVHIISSLRKLILGAKTHKTDFGMFTLLKNLMKAAGYILSSHLPVGMHERSIWYEGSIW